jgi:CheY-like chemotaxis protein
VFVVDRNSKTVLVVEDYEDVREMLKILLQSDHYRVLEAATGAEAIDTVRRERPDVILMDLALPEFDGFETMRRIRKIDGFQNIPVVVLTAYSRQGFYEAAVRAGGNYFISKPIDFDELEELLGRILEDSDHKKPKNRRSAAQRAMGSHKTLPPERKISEVRWRDRVT